MEKLLTNSLINLNSLLDFSDKLNKTFDFELILNSTLLSLMGKLKVFRACVLREFEDGTVTPTMSKGKLTADCLNKKFTSYDDAEKVLTVNGYKYFLPIMYESTLFAKISLGEKADNSVLTEEEWQYSGLVCRISANAIENARNKQSLEIEKSKVEQRHQLLTTLYEAGRDLSMLLTREQIIKMLTNYLMGQLTISRFSIILFGNGFECEVINNRSADKPGKNVVDEIKRIENITGVEEIDLDNKTAEYLKNINARIISPMKVQGEIKGVMFVGRKMTGSKFDGRDLMFIESIGNYAISALENNRLFKEEVEKKKLESELKLALEIQKNLLPETIPEIEGYDIAGTSLPSRHVGGDYFDVIRLNDKEILIAIADVSGKGMPASLLMANVQAALRVLAPLGLPVINLILKINELVYNNTSADKFVTFFCGILNHDSGEFTYVNAGHNPPLFLKSNGYYKTLSEGGLIIGFTDEPFDYKQGMVTLNSGDSILMFTDGITESLDAQNKEYGEENLRSVFKNIIGYPAKKIVDEIVKDVVAHSKGLGQYDDITCIVLKRK